MPRIMDEVQPQNPSPNQENYCSRQNVSAWLRNVARRKHEEAVRLQKLADWAETLSPELESILYEALLKKM